jgi:hypothetical protein
MGISTRFTRWLWLPGFLRGCMTLDFDSESKSFFPLALYCEANFLGLGQTISEPFYFFAGNDRLQFHIYSSSQPEQSF